MAYLLYYENIYSRFLERVTDYNLLSLEEDDMNSLFSGWLRSAASTPRIRRLFSSFSIDNDGEQITFELRNSVDEDSDALFVEDLLSLGMAIRWLQQQIDSVLNTAPMIGGKEEKKLIDNHKYSIQRLAEMKTEQQNLIRDYGCMYNSYLNGE